MFDSTNYSPGRIISPRVFVNALVYVDVSRMSRRPLCEAKGAFPRTKVLTVELVHGEVLRVSSSSTARRRRTPREESYRTR